VCIVLRECVCVVCGMLRDTVCALACLSCVCKRVNVYMCMRVCVVYL